MSKKTELAPGEMKEAEIDILRFDFSTLVGRKLTLFSEQLGSRPLESRVIVAGDNAVTIDRSGGAGLVDSLVHNQRVTVRAKYRGEEIAINGVLKRTGAKTCKIQFDEKVVPLTRRRYPRVFVSKSVCLAALPVRSLMPRKLSRLRWLVTDTINLSGGGTLIGSSSHLEPPSYLCLNIDFSEISFPKLVVGQVRHCSQIDCGKYQIGIAFIPREDRNKHLNNATVKELPAGLFAYDEVSRYLLTERIVTWTQKH